MRTFALLSDDKADSLIIDGAMSINEVSSGRITDRTTVANRFIVDGRIIQPRIVTIEAVVSPNPLIEELPRGDKRIDKFLEWLTDAKERAIILAIQVPGRQILENMVLESFSTSKGRSDSINVSMSFKEVRLARTRSTVLTQAPKKPKGSVRDNFKAGLDAEKEKGTKPKEDISTLYSLKETSKPLVGAVYQFITGQPPAWDRGSN